MIPPIKEVLFNEYLRELAKESSFNREQSLRPSQ
jgi:hypothetical protein